MKISLFTLTLFNFSARLGVFYKRLIKYKKIGKYCGTVSPFLSLPALIRHQMGGNGIFTINLRLKLTCLLIRIKYGLELS